MALICQLVDDTNVNKRQTIEKSSKNKVDFIDEQKKQKFTLYLYPLMLDDTEVQFVLQIFCKNKYGLWKTGKKLNF